MLDNISLSIPGGQMGLDCRAIRLRHVDAAQPRWRSRRSTSGDIRVAGESLATWSHDALTGVRDKLGLIFQFVNLLATRSCPRKSRPPAAPSRLAELEDCRPRVRAVNLPATRADEPTGNLDTHAGPDIRMLIRDVHLRLGSTIVIVTHDISVTQSCERAVALRDGRIAGDVTR